MQGAYGDFFAAGAGAGLDRELSEAFGSPCQPCPAGWLSVSPGSDECEPCPRGTYSTRRGLSRWDGCALCPTGTASASLGATNCTPCSVPYASPLTACPAGTIEPSSAADWPLRDQSFTLTSLRSVDFPEVSEKQVQQEVSLSRTQVVR